MPQKYASNNVSTEYLQPKMDWIVMKMEPITIRDVVNLVKLDWLLVTEGAIAGLYKFAHFKIIGYRNIG